MPQTIPFTGSMLEVTSIHSPPSLWSMCGSSSAPVSYGRQTVALPTKLAVVDTSK